MLGAVCPVPVPLNSAVDEALEPRGADDVEMLPFSELSDEIEKKIVCSATSGARSFLTASGTSSVPSLSDPKRGLEDKELNGNRCILSSTVPASEGAGMVPVPVYAVGDIAVIFSFLSIRIYGYSPRFEKSVVFV